MSDKPRLKLSRFVLNGLPGLDGPAELGLEADCTVIVGPNGVGKSLLLDGLWDATVAVVSSPDHRTAPNEFTCEATQGDQTLKYHYKRSLHVEGRKTSVHWEEECWVDSKAIWKVTNGSLEAPNWDGSLTLPSGHSVLTLDKDIAEKMGPLVAALHDLMWGVNIVRSGIPRAGARERYLVTVEDDVAIDTGAPRLRGVAEAAVGWHVRNDNRAHVLRELLLRLEVAGSMEFVEFHRADQSERHISLVLDGVDIGLASDGVARIAEIIVKVLRSPSDAVMLLEEPETGLHPGLIERLCAEFETMMLEHQLVVSTHSSQIVDWAKKDWIRVVSRQKGLTRTRPLDVAEKAEVQEYLQDEGTLGEYVFGDLR